MNAFVKGVGTAALLVAAAGSVLMAMGGREGRIVHEIEGDFHCEPSELATWLVIPKARRKWVGHMKDYEDVDYDEMAQGKRVPVVLDDDGDKTQLMLQVLKLDADKLVVLNESSAGYDAESRFEMDYGITGRTHVTYTRTVQFKGFFRKLFAPVSLYFMKESMADDFRRLKKSATFDFA